MRVGGFYWLQSFVGGLVRLIQPHQLPEGALFQNTSSHLNLRFVEHKFLHRVVVSK